jgi:GT2 family glycosyltransferase
MTGLNDLRVRTVALIDRYDQLLLDLDRLRGTRPVAVGGGVSEAAATPALLAAEMARLDRAVGWAQRRQLVRLMPVHGRLAYVRLVIARVGARFSRAATPVSAVPPFQPTALRSVKELEAAFGEALGRLVLLRSELARAEQDVFLRYRALVRRAARKYFDRRRAAVAARGARRVVPSTPRVSVLTAVYNTTGDLLEAQLRSVARQTFADFEHVLVNDGSRASHIEPLLNRAALHDLRRVVIHRGENGGIIAASADALSAARGEFIALVDHDDLIEPTALERMVAALDEQPDAVLAYSDHDILSADGRCFDPFYKPDFSPERLRGQNYITHFFVARRSAVEAVGGFRPGFDGSQDHDLALRLGEHGPVVHVPGVLYHWRQAPGSVASDEHAKPYAYDAGQRAVDEHCARVGIAAEVVHGAMLGTYALRRSPTSSPLVSVIIPTRGSSGVVWGSEREYVVDAVKSIEQHSTYRDLEYVVVADSATPASVLERLRAVGGERMRVVMFDEQFNFSRKCNVGVAAATGEVLLFLNDDTELVEPDSIRQMVGYLEESDVGMVGAKLRFADGRVQHAGHVYPGCPAHALYRWPDSSVGPHRMMLVARECSGVTAAAAAMRRELFESLGGFNETFPVNFNDVDLCLRVRRGGHRIVWTPAAAWFHFESVTREAVVFQDEVDRLYDLWESELHSDPYFNECLLPGRDDWLPRPLLGGVSAHTLGGR